MASSTALIVTSQEKMASSTALIVTSQEIISSDGKSLSNENRNKGID